MHEEDSRPSWDEDAACFWCPAGVNAYDIPDGLQWQQAFRGAFSHYEPDLFRDRGYFQEVSNILPRRLDRPELRTGSVKNPQYEGLSSAMPTVLVRERGESPITPTKKPNPWKGRDSPKTPPLFRAVSPRTRALRATHTKALLSMKTKAGVSAMVQGHELAFFRFGGEVFAVSARCPHQGGNLCEGEVGDIEDLVPDEQCAGSSGLRSRYVTCPVHKMQFNLRDGSVLVGNCAPLPTFRVRIAEVDDARKCAPIEVGFESLTENYFGEVHF